MINYLCAAQGIQTRVLDVGKGPVIVFVHGLGARADRWIHNLAPVAAQGYRCLAIDLPGHGFASKTADFPFTVPRCADWVISILDAIGIQTFSLVGTSLGGFISGYLTCEHPDRVSALALVGTIGVTPLGSTARTAIASRFGTVTRAGIASKLNTVLFQNHLVTEAWIEEEWRINNSEGAQAAFSTIANYIRLRIDEDVMGERLATLAARPPVAVIWGTEDVAVPLDVGHRARNLLRPNLYVEIPATGHGPYLENPARFNHVLLGFLNASGETAIQP